jgi:hypoxanthine phosphoribosyltransferase
MADERITKILDAERIDRVVSSIAERINSDYRDKEIVLVCCLTGAFVFMADLMRKLSVEATCDFIKVSSYEDRMTPGDLVLELDVVRPIEGKRLVVVEDIIDTGQTLNFIRAHLSEKHPASVDLCALLYKETPRSTLPKEEVRYLGETVPDAFVVGYGIDYAQRYRTLPYVATIERK